MYPSTVYQVNKNLGYTKCS